MSTMLQKIIIRNFQAHKKTVLNLVEGVNVIVGPSASGKSTIIRALNWVIFNRPVGDVLHSHWGGKLSVKLIFDEGSVTRIRNGTKNHYILQLEGEDKQTFAGFGQNVPAAVSEFINMNELNIQRQLAAPFLLSKSAGEVAQELNRIANLQDIDLSLKTATKRLARVQRQVSTYDEVLKDINGRLSALPDIDTALTVAERVETRIKESITNTNQIEKLEGLISSLSDIEKEINELPTLEDVDDIFTRISERAHKLELLLSFIERLDAVVENIVEIGEELSKHQLVPEIDSIIVSLEKREKLLVGNTEGEGRLGKLIDEYINNSNKLDNINDKLEAYEAELNELTPEVCPLCGQNFPKE